MSLKFITVHSLIALLALAPLALTPRSVEAQTSTNIEEAKRFFEQGSAKFKEGKYDGARKDFEESFNLSKNKVLYFNIAKSYEGEKDLVNARKYYIMYLEGVENPPNRSDVEKVIESLEAQLKDVQFPIELTSKQVGTVSVYINDDARPSCQIPCQLKLIPGHYHFRASGKNYTQEVDYEVTLDPDQVVDFPAQAVGPDMGALVISVDAPLRVKKSSVADKRVTLQGEDIFQIEEGDYRVSLRTDDYDYVSTARIEPGKTTELNIKLKDLDRVQDLALNWKMPVGLSLIGVGLGLSAGAIIMGITTNQYKEAADLANTPETTDAYNQLLERGKDMKLWTNIAWGTSAAFAAVGLSFVFWDLFSVPTLEDKEVVMPVN